MACRRLMRVWAQKYCSLQRKFDKYMMTTPLRTFSRIPKEKSSQDVKLLICGAGNGAQTMAGIASSRPNVQATVLSLYEDEAARWSNAMEDGFTINMHENGVEENKIEVSPFPVTNDPATAEGMDIIALPVPAFAHATYLEALKSFLRPGTVLLGSPGQGGFEFAVWGILGPVSKFVTIISTESLPWACRIKEFGKEVDVLGIKVQLDAAIAHGRSPPRMPVTEMMRHVWGDHPELVIKGDLIGMTLMCANAYVHPSFMFAKWKDWDGTPVEEAPLFYHGVDDTTIELIEAVSNEVKEIANKVKSHHDKLDFSNLISIYDLVVHFYEDEIEDKSSLKHVFLTNRAYAGITFPMSEIETGQLVPNFNYRYLTEDVPYGLVVLRGIAEIAGVDTPVIDKLILWSQDKMGKEYLKDGSLKGKDINDTRAPQAFGFTTMKDLVQTN